MSEVIHDVLTIEWGGDDLFIPYYFDSLVCAILPPSDNKVGIVDYHSTSSVLSPNWELVDLCEHFSDVIINYSSSSQAWEELYNYVVNKYKSFPYFTLILADKSSDWNFAAELSKKIQSKLKTPTLAILAGDDIKQALVYVHPSNWHYATAYYPSTGLTHFNAFTNCVEVCKVSYKIAIAFRRVYSMHQFSHPFAGHAAYLDTVLNIPKILTLAEIHEMQVNTPWLNSLRMTPGHGVLVWGDNRLDGEVINQGAKSWI